MENKQQSYLYYIGLPSAIPCILRWHGPFSRKEAVKEIRKFANRGMLPAKAKYLSTTHLNNLGTEPLYCNQPFGRCIRFSASGVPMLARPITEKGWEALFELIDNEL